jgi:hypothetical protein
MRLSEHQQRCTRIVQQFTADFEAWAAQIRAEGKEDEMIAWGNILAAAIRRGWEPESAGTKGDDMTATKGDDMTAQTDRYCLVRRPEHATIGDAIERYDRDADAFTAGVQHALDKMTGTVDRLLMDPHTSEYLIDMAANILANVHAGLLD